MQKRNVWVVAVITLLMCTFSALAQTVQTQAQPVQAQVKLVKPLADGPSLPPDPWDGCDPGASCPSCPWYWPFCAVQRIPLPTPSGGALAIAKFTSSDDDACPWPLSLLLPWCERGRLPMPTIPETEVTPVTQE